MESGNEQSPDFEKIQNLANSSAGKKLMALLHQNQESVLREAMDQAASGDITKAKAIVEKLLSSPEAATLVREIRGSK